jgi:hypothetical protein
MRRFGQLGPAIFVLAGVFFSPAPALSRADAESPYTLQQTFSAALRLLRVDLNLEVTEKDPEASYLIFNYRSGDDPKRAILGAIELVQNDNVIKIVIKIPQLPQSHERLIRDRLVKKLKDDYGPPPKRAETPKPPDVTPEKPPEKAPDKPDKPDKP